jgi:hypothetical protein
VPQAALKLLFLGKELRGTPNLHAAGFQLES